MNNKSYFNLIMGDGDNSFIRTFNKNWDHTLDSIVTRHKNGKQLNIGNRLRPRLLAWGYCFNTQLGDIINFEQIADIAVGIELLHKASIILDDLIDKDIKRNGEPAFHIEYGEDETIIFGLMLVGLSMKKIISGNLKMPQNYNVMVTNAQLLNQTLCDMAEGALRELTMGKDEFTNINYIKKIIDLETVSILKNSLFLGYINNCDDNPENENLLLKIGELSGYLFQVLNDIEPFTQNEKILKHKGLINIDINHCRKNIVFSYLNSYSSIQERRVLSSFENSSVYMSTVISLYEKYNIKNIILSDLKQIENEIFDFHSNLNSYNSEWLREFKDFVGKLIKYCLNKILNDAGHINE